MKRTKQRYEMKTPPKKVLDFGEYSVVFCDSAEALRRLVEQGLNPDATVRTVSPYLLRHKIDKFDIQAMEAPIKGERYRTFRKAIKPLGIDVYDICQAHDVTREYARTIARAAAAAQNVTLNASCLSDADFREPRLIVRLETGNSGVDTIINGPWHNLMCSSHFARVVTVKINLPTSLDLKDPATLRRWMHQGAEYLGYRLALVLSNYAAWLFKKDKVALLLKDNDLLFETAFHLVRNRIRLERLDQIKIDDETDMSLLTTVDNLLRETMEKFVSKFVCKEAVDPCVDIAIMKIATQASRQKAAQDKWKSILSEVRKENRRAVILSNYPGRPEESGLFLACQDAKIPIIAFQHGVSREINANYGDVGLENSAAHVTIVYNEAARERSDATQFHHGTTLPVGYPKIGRRNSRLPMVAFEPTETILFASTNVYRGYQHMVTTAMTDEQMAELEIKIICDVFAHTRYRVTYKSYPYVGRYADPDPALIAASKLKNVSIVTNNVDLRYLVGSARVVISARATSTIGWCLMANKPLCFIDVPDHLPLNMNARAAFEDALFVFDARSPDFTASMRSFLSLPLEEIERRWKEKRAARDRLIAHFIDLPGASGGRRAASYILEHCFSSEFFTAHPYRAPMRTTSVCSLLRAIEQRPMH